ncbi:acetolactate synthase 1 [Pyrus ussuriensis x Pyrus communis]|uniref:acetolactate synthase n=1 Tax=Pyrus ussuriensis x Pyrus communis TaxID=2448454 RepID=A0A5N5HGY4_9ROSA|nr:acetolactate synthase 1 [Pyrus ussuriensis x Pyrus communis]
MEINQTLTGRMPDGIILRRVLTLTHSSSIRNVLLPHEQGGVLAAEGYTRESGCPSVCIATSRLGATNLVSGLAEALMDSIPMTPIVKVTRSITKHNYLVIDVKDIPGVVREAIFLATSGQPSPVLINVPKDVQQQLLPGYMARLPKSPNEGHLEQIVTLVSESKKSVLYVGGGCLNSSEELRRFVELIGIPVANTLMGLGAYPCNDEDLSLQMLGMHGTVYANYDVEKSNLLLAFGVRFDDQVTRKLKAFASRAKIVHIDIDSVCGDVKLALQGLNRILEGKESKVKLDFSAWRAELKEQKVNTGVGQHQIRAAQFYKYKQPRQWLTSGGLGAMGFGLPVAIGAAVAIPDSVVVDIDEKHNEKKSILFHFSSISLPFLHIHVSITNIFFSLRTFFYSFLMNVQELATISVEKLPVKIMLLNNQHLGMVVQWEDRFYKANKAHNYLGNPANESEIFPNMLKFAVACGIPATQVTKKEDLKAAIQKMLDTPGLYLLDVIVPHQEHVLPMIPSGGAFKDVITEGDGRSSY